MSTSIAGHLVKDEDLSRVRESRIGKMLLFG